MGRLRTANRIRSRHAGALHLPQDPFSDLGPLGSSTTVNLRLQSALPKGTYDWRTWSAAYRSECEADGITSVTIQDAEGGAGLSEVGQPYARIPVILVEVSLTRKRVFAITPNGGNPGSWRTVGQPEQLTIS